LSSIPCTTNTTNINGAFDDEAGLPGTNVANTYGAGVLISTCLQPGTYQFYKFVNGRVVPVSGGPPVAAAPAPARPANAPFIQTAAGLSTPRCGLGIQPYPSCPPSADDERIAEGYRINPVPLNLTGLDPRKVGIGSYWVNSAGNCDGCHGGTNGGQFTAAQNPQNLPVALGGTYTGNYHSSTATPYNPTASENPVSFLGGGANFGSPTGACDASGMGGCGPAPTDLFVRNITPDFSTGLPVPEANTLQEFIETLRTGHDFQQIHLNCPPLGTGTAPNCLNAPADGSKLNIMPWPALGSATDYDLESIYAYLTAIPCIPTAAAPTGTEAPPTHTCPAPNSPTYGTATYHQYQYVNGQAARTD